MITGFKESIQALFANRIADLPLHDSGEHTGPDPHAPPQASRAALHTITSTEPLGFPIPLRYTDESACASGPAQIHQHSHRSQLTCQRLYSFQGRQTKDTGSCLFLTVTLAESTVTNTETAWAAIRTTYFLLHQWPRMRGILIRYWPSSLSSY